MSTAFFLILIIAIAGVAAIGMLSNEIMITAQNLKVLPSITDIAGDPEDDTDGTFFCTCENPDNLGEFGMEFCELGPGQTYYPSQMLCTWETTASLYGSGVEYYGEGCTFEFWKKHIGFNPQQYVKKLQLTSKLLVIEAKHLEKKAVTDEEKLGALFAQQMSIVSEKMEKTSQLIGMYENQEDKDQIKQERLELKALYDRMMVDTPNISEFLSKVKLLAETLMDDAMLLSEMDNEISAWPPGYEPDRGFNMMFQTTISLPDERGDPTLLKTLDTDGKGKIKQLLREAVAAMLNAAHPKIQYKYKVSEVMKITQGAISDNDYQRVIDEFSKYNSLGSPVCPLK